jgi:hypothetical protein
MPAQVDPSQIIQVGRAEHPAFQKRLSADSHQ